MRKGVKGGGEPISDQTGRSGGNNVAEFGEPIDVEKDGDKTREDLAEFGEPIQVERKEEKLGEAM